MLLFSLLFGLSFAGLFYFLHYIFHGDEERWAKDMQKLAERNKND